MKRLKIDRRLKAVVFVALMVLSQFTISSGQIQPGCMEPQSPGICRERILRYAYETLSGNCIPFYYTGCTATGNNYLTYEECRRECMENNIY
ncbi:kunitz-type serine protease inhibitor HCRG2-like [Teleopsis dalmanni]|uniref:kunitz-type serine protease inhibitor HCRG2-like n=1 Tax=Teleopsis dalmanni TaxID=139649 RepID=UPI0018CEB3D1|nr:kunitz-type serine protease inhibitor HCRG2-like [Teleopsis dalmanni]